MNNRVKIKGDTPYGVTVEVNGVKLSGIRALRLELSAGDKPDVLVLEVCADEVDLEVCGDISVDREAE